MYSSQLEAGSSRHAVRKLRSKLWAHCNHRTIHHLSVNLNLKTAEAQSERGDRGREAGTDLQVRGKHKISIVRVRLMDRDEKRAVSSRRIIQPTSSYVGLQKMHNSDECGCQ